MSYFRWPPYVPVAKRRANAARELAKLKKKKGFVAQPVELNGSRIATSFWGKSWCDHMESFSDFDNRLPRGRTYVRNGSVCHLGIQPGKVEAIVSGSALYNVTIIIAPLKRSRWTAIRSTCAGKIGSLLDLLRGKLASGVMEVVCHRQTGLFPLPGEIKFHCDCPDWASMCKHVAAVLYGVGARLDSAPEQLFLLRGVDHNELVDVAAAVESATKAGSRRRIGADSLADVFGIDLAEPAENPDGQGVKPDGPSIKKEKVITASTKKSAAAPQRAVASQPAAAPPRPFPTRLTGTAICKWRDALGETQSGFARRLGVTAASISQWERKGRQILQLRDSTLAALKRAWAEHQATGKG